MLLKWLSLPIAGPGSEIEKEVFRSAPSIKPVQFGLKSERALKTLRVEEDDPVAKKPKILKLVQFHRIHVWTFREKINRFVSTVHARFRCLHATFQLPLCPRYLHFIRHILESEIGRSKFDSLDLSFPGGGGDDSVISKETAQGGGEIEVLPFYF